MIRNGIFALAVLAGGTAAAEDLIGPRDVWPGFEYGRCDSYLVDLPCLTAAGAPQGALRFIKAAAADPDIGMLVIPTHFTELGTVDLVEVDFPGLANTNQQQMLVNGDPSIVWPANWSSEHHGGDGGTLAVLRKYPQAFPSGHIVVTGHRTLPGGIQRFVLADMLVNGCRGCEPVGDAYFQLDFIDGAFSGLYNLGWSLAEPVGSHAQRVADLRRGDVALLQALLNGHGFQAGPMDGHGGQQTRAALDAFKAEHCLTGEADLSAKVVAALTAPGPWFATPPCARVLAPPLANPLGLPDGEYVSDARLCPPGNDAFLSQIGDGAYSMAVTLKGNRFYWGESGCTILSVTQRGRALDLGMACMAEGMAEDRVETVTPQPPDALAWRGDTFRRCGATGSAPESAPEQDTTATSPVFPLADGMARVNAIFGAAGPGADADPRAYVSEQYHLGADLRAGTDAVVSAPVDGTIVYYHRNAGNGEARWLQTFFVLRDKQNRDWVFAHVECTVCGSQRPIGDLGVWPKSAQVTVRAGMAIGKVANLMQEGYGPHLHLGLSQRPIVGSDGILLADYRAGNWGRVLYRETEPGAREAAAAKAAALGFVDPMRVLRP